MRIIRPHEKFALLIAESDATARRQIEEAAAATDRFWSVHTMADGRFVLEHLWGCLEQGTGEVPDILVANTRLSGLGGTQLTRELRRYEELRRVFVAQFSATGAPLEQDAAENAGCDFFLRYPKSHDDLVAALQAIANRCGMKAIVPERRLN